MSKINVQLRFVTGDTRKDKPIRQIAYEAFMRKPHVRSPATYFVPYEQMSADSRDRWDAVVRDIARVIRFRDRRDRRHRKT